MNISTRLSKLETAANLNRLVMIPYGIAPNQEQKDRLMAEHGVGETDRVIFVITGVCRHGD